MKNVYDRELVFMAFNFAADPAELEVLASELRSTMSDIDSFVADIYTIVDDMSNVWSGDDYEAFKARCVKFKGHYEELLSALETFANETKVMADDSASLIESVMSALDVSGISVKGMN